MFTVKLSISVYSVDDRFFYFCDIRYEVDCETCRVMSGGVNGL